MIFVVDEYLLLFPSTLYIMHLVIDLTYDLSFLSQAASFQRVPTAA
jgi:hypothetical protein